MATSLGDDILHPGTLKRRVHEHPYFRDWEDARFKAIAPHSRILDVAEGTEIIPLQDLGPYSHFLLSGGVTLTAENGDARRLTAGDLDAHFPFAHLRPSRYRVVAATASCILQVESSRLRKMPKTDDRARFRLVEHATAGSWQAHPLVVDVLRKLRERQLDIPPLPGIALKVRRALQREDVEVSDVATIISADPAIAGRLISISNSAIFGMQATVDTVSGALVRLGLERAQNIVLSLATQDLYVAKQPFVRQALLERWRHAIDIAALCAVLGKLTPRLNSDVGMLVGLLHEIGAVPILLEAQNYPDLAQTPGVLEEILGGLVPQVSQTVLATWEFAGTFSDAAAAADNWFHDHDGDGDYTDMLIVAHLHALVKQRDFKKLPRLDETPAFQKLAVGLLSPQLSLLVLDEAKSQIGELRSLLV